MLENRVIVTSLTTLGVVMSAGALVISIVAVEGNSAHPVMSAVAAEVPSSTTNANFAAQPIMPTLESEITEASPSESPLQDNPAPISVTSQATSPVANVSFTRSTANTIPVTNLRPRDLCVHWQIYKWVDSSPNPVRIGEYYEECDSATLEDAEAVPYSLINQENKMLRDQLSFIVGRLEWEDYLQLSSEYAQLH